MARNNKRKMKVVSQVTSNKIAKLSNSIKEENRDNIVNINVDSANIQSIGNSSKNNLPTKLDFNESHKYFTELDQVEFNEKKFKIYVENNYSIFINGPVGCGKTSFVEFMSRKMCRSITKVQISEDADDKTLIGGYCCSNVPGDFVWRNGPLINAMSKGHWLLLEDIMCGQPSILGRLKPLFEAGKEGMTPKIPDPYNIDKSIVAHENFRIILTHSVADNADLTKNHNVFGFRGNCLSHCQTISFQQLHNEDLVKIITSNYPKLRHLVQNKFLGENGLFQQLQSIQRGPNLRTSTLRDLFKYCFRLNQGKAEQRNYFLDGYDCFVQHIPDLNVRDRVTASVGAIANVSNTENILKHSNISVSQTMTEATIGRVKLQKVARSVNETKNTFAQTNQSKLLLESLARCVEMKEPVLLVSETGCGKTTTVQYLSKLIGRKLVVINMNQQSDSSDLLGGYKPINRIDECYNTFVELMKLCFPLEQIDKFLIAFEKWDRFKNYGDILKMISSVKISKRVLEDEKLAKYHFAWKQLQEYTTLAKEEYETTKSALNFAFIEGALVNAVKNGEWVLLDEVNLAPSEMLQSLSGLLESSKGSLTLSERGDTEPIQRHPDFLLFACMNPATDVGKKSLPTGLRNRFTEIYLNELTDSNELNALIGHYLPGVKFNLRDLLVSFYLELRQQVSSNRLVDGCGNKPQFSLRTLCRALRETDFIINNKQYRASQLVAIYEGLSFSFRCQLSDQSRKIFDAIFLKGFKISEMKPIAISVKAEELSGNGYIDVAGYALERGPEWQPDMECNNEIVRRYKITESVRKNLSDLARILAAGERLPVLVQGETSVGKTSIIGYMAALTGHHCHRINNHETTDIQEYVGCYVANMKFQEGLLARAMRQGHWIILDELNLAPTDILEALNRVLDDNRELYIPETRTTIVAHPNFRLFATQNPPGLYGGRKILSRALRNRFIELQFNPIPDPELVEILDCRCHLAPSRGARMVALMRDFQKKCQELDMVHSSGAVNVSLRDLMRWAKRVVARKASEWQQAMLEEGYMLFGGRCRSRQELGVVKDALEKAFKISCLESDRFFSPVDSASSVCRDILTRLMRIEAEDVSCSGVEWTMEFRRLAVLLVRAMENSEPVLLIGDTGCGKTTISQLASRLLGRNMRTINCHQHTEASDFLGSLKPIGGGEDNARFRWENGPLITAMEQGEVLLIDEISLADDSVLERLNSVLETDRKITLVENGENKSGTDGGSNEITATENFAVIATMNPGGDFGKKELSPALRNRFTEIWCPSDNWLLNKEGRQDWIRIAGRHLVTDRLTLEKKIQIASVIVDFLRHLHKVLHEVRFSVVSIRDLLAWSKFVSKAVMSGLGVFEALEHGVCMVVLDSIPDGHSGNRDSLRQKLHELAHDTLCCETDHSGEQPARAPVCLETANRRVGMGLFSVEMGPHVSHNPSDYVLDTKNGNESTVSANTYRLCRAMWSDDRKPLLLEGSPGVGKTSLVVRLAQVAGFKVVRINLSEKTDANDLIGCFLPVENAREFAWRDGPLLQAIKSGDWILLDEMNLASQSVLESLNACLDHRAELFVPDLRQTFPFRSRLFACQNPVSEGGGRKSLPRSFVNRFTQVHMSSLTGNDYRHILTSLYSVRIAPTHLELMVRFVGALQRAVMIERRFGSSGSPWEFNVRDLTRWCQLMLELGCEDPALFVRLLFEDRFRCGKDREAIRRLYDEEACAMGANSAPVQRGVRVAVCGGDLIVGQASLRLVSDHNEAAAMCSVLSLLPGQLTALESLALAVQMGWMVLLAGGPGSGKSALIRQLAGLTGHRLETVSVHSGLDATELLGSFEQQQEGGVFRWVDSALVTALRRGHWLVLDAANACDASVLDRLNGLLEPGGSLLMTERGIVSNSGQIEEIRPHPDFRLFLVLDPMAGEVSRAMRNRGLELCLPDGLQSADDRLGILCGRFGVDNASQLIQKGSGGSAVELLHAGTLWKAGMELDVALQTAYINPQEDIVPVGAVPTLCVPISSLLADPRIVMATAQTHAAVRTLQQLQPTPADRAVLARMLATEGSMADCTNKSDLLRGADREMQLAFGRVVALLQTRHQPVDNDQIIDPRWLPCWRHYLNHDFSSINRTMFMLMETSNDELSWMESVSALPLSALRKERVAQMTVHQISWLLQAHRLSPGVQLSLGFYKTVEDPTTLWTFLERLRADLASDILNQSPESAHQVVQLKQLLFSMLHMSPAVAGRSFLPGLVYIVSRLADSLDQLGTTQQYDMASLLRTLQGRGYVPGREERKDRFMLREAFPHSELQYELVPPIDNELSPEKRKELWYCDTREQQHETLTEMLLATDRQLSLDQVRVLPLLLTVAVRVLRSGGVPELAQLLRRWEDRSMTVRALMPACLRQCLHEDETGDKDVMMVRHTTVVDLSAFLLGQIDMQQVLASCDTVYDEETERHQLCVIANHTGIVKARQSLLSEGYDQAVLSLLHSAGGGTVRHMASHRTQLALTSQVLREEAALLATGGSRLQREKELLQQMTALQTAVIDAVPRCGGAISSGDWGLDDVRQRANNLRQQLLSEHETLKDCGRLWLQWAAIQMRLFALVEPVDPHWQRTWDREHTQAETARLEREEAVVLAYRAHLTGMEYGYGTGVIWSRHGMEHPLIDSLQVRLAQLRDEAFQYSDKKPQGALRPLHDSEGAYATLQARVADFLERHGWTQLDQIIDGSEKMENKVDALEQWSVAATELLKSVTEDARTMRNYPEMLEPFCVGVSRGLAGISMIASAKIDERSEASGRVVAMMCAYPNVDSVQLAAGILSGENEILNDMDVMQGRTGENQDRVEQHMRLLRLCVRLLEEAAVTTVGCEQRRQSVRNSLRCVVDVYSAVWARQEERRLEHEKKEASLYLLREELTRDLDELQEAEVEVLLATCPSEMLADMPITSKQVRDAVLRVRGHGGCLRDRALVLAEDSVSQLVEACKSILCPNSTTAATDSARIREDGVYGALHALAAELVAADPVANRCDEVRALPGHMAAIARAQLVAQKEDIDDDTYDMYRDPARAADVAPLLGPLREMDVRVEQLLALYPDHLSLQQVRLCAIRLANTPAGKPLVQLLAGLELLLDAISKWELAAAKHVSLMEYANSLRTVLAGWRHRELMLWRDTLRAATRRQSKQVLSRAFMRHLQALTTCLAALPAEGLAAAVELLTPLHQEARSSSMGQLSALMEVVQLLVHITRHLLPVSGLGHELACMLQNLHDHYALQTANVRSSLERQYTNLDKELRDFIRTKKWGSGPPRLADVHKCHNTVFRFLRKWNDCLSAPVTDCAVVTVPTAELLTIKWPEDSDQTIEKAALAVWGRDTLDYFTDVWSLVQQMQTETRQLEQQGQEAAKEVEDKDDNEKEKAQKKWRATTNNLQQRKIKLLSAVLKQMREMGVSGLMDCEFSYKSAIVTHLPRGDFEFRVNAPSVIRCLELRAQLAEIPHLDNEYTRIPDAAIKLTHLCDNLLALAAKNTVNLSLVGERAIDLSRLLGQLRASVVLGPICDTGFWPDAQEALHDWLGALSQHLQHLQRFCQLGGIADNGTGIEALIEILRDTSSETSHCNGWFMTADNKRVIAKARALQTKVHTEITDINNSVFGETSMLHPTTRLHIRVKYRGARSVDSEELLESLMDDLLATLAKSCNNIETALAVGDLMKFSTVLKHVERLRTTLNGDGIDDIVQKVRVVCLKMEPQSVNTVFAKFEKQVSASVDKHQTLVAGVVNMLKCYHGVVLSGLEAMLVLARNLAEKGFCVPDDSAWNQPDKQQNAAETEKMNNFETAGMDEGKGMNDVSDQIEGEHQLEGLKNDEEEKQDQEDMDDVEEQDNGVEMSEDFEAKIHDPDTKEDDEDNDDKNGDDQDKLDELEDQMGEVGDAQEMNMDKEAWDDEKNNEDDEQQEKNTDDREGQKCEDKDKKADKDDAEGEEGAEDKDDENKNGDEQEATGADNDHEMDDKATTDDTFQEEGTNQPEETPEEFAEDEELFDMLDGDEREETQEENVEMDDKPAEEDVEMKENGEEIKDDAEEENGNTEEASMVEDEDKINAGMFSSFMPQIDFDDLPGESLDQSDAQNAAENDGETGANSGGSGQSSDPIESSHDNKDEDGTQDNDECQQDNAETKENQSEMKKPSEQRTLGDQKKNRKRKAETQEFDENSKKVKKSDVYEHMENDDQDAEEMVDDATASQQMDIAEAEDVAPEEEEDGAGDEEKGSSEKRQLEDIEASNRDEKKSDTNKRNEKKDYENKNDSSHIENDVMEVKKESWDEYEARTEPLSRQMCEMLRTVLEPTKATKLGGAFRTGKRLNMKRVIAFVASNFIKDKIWSRRCKPSVREYQVIVAVDNSTSMLDFCDRTQILESLSVLLSGLTYLEAGRMGLYKFGNGCRIIHSLLEGGGDSNILSAVGERLLDELDFTDRKSQYNNVLTTAIAEFEAASALRSSTGGRVDKSQMLLMLSDGGMHEEFDDPKLIQLLREAHNRNIFVIVVMLNKDTKMIQKVYMPKTNTFVPYLDLLPYKHLSVDNVNDLPHKLTELLRQWFEMAASEDMDMSRQ